MTHRGAAYTLAILFNRVVPAKLLRLFWLNVYELQAEETSKTVDSAFHIDEVVSPIEQELIRGITQYAPGGGLNQTAWALYDQQEMVGGIWIAEQSFDERTAGIRFVLSPDQSWLFAARLLPQIRGRGAYGVLLDHVLGRSGGGAGRHYYAAINPVNRRSLLAHRSRIKRTVGALLCLRIFGKTVLFRCHGDLRRAATNVNDRIHISIADGKADEFKESEM